MQLSKLFLALVVCLSVGVRAQAQPETAEKPEAAEKPTAAEKTPAPPEKSDAKEPAATEGPAAEFAAKYSEWKQLVAKLFQIKERFQNDPSVDKKALEAEFQATLAKAEAMARPLEDSALAAYQAAPNQDPELSDFLASTVIGHVMSDSYERGAALGKVLVENKATKKELNLLTGVACFNSSDFDGAEKYLNAAKENGTLDPNGERLLGLVDKYKEMWAKEQKIREAEAKAKNLPQVKLTTSKGDITVELFENEAPNTVANFISLVEKKFYDGLPFHRVLQGFMAQGGDPKGDGTGGPGYTIPCECYQANHRNHFRGSLSMAKGRDKDTGGSQFFLTFVPTTHLDGQHTVFGRVVDGMDVLDQLVRIQPGEPGVPDKIVKATVLSKRKHRYEPLKRPDKNPPKAAEKGSTDKGSGKDSGKDAKDSDKK